MSEVMNWKQDVGLLGDIILRQKLGPYDPTCHYPLEPNLTDDQHACKTFDDAALYIAERWRDGELSDAELEGDLRLARKQYSISSKKLMRYMFDTALDDLTEIYEEGNLEERVRSLKYVLTDDDLQRYYPNIPLSQARLDCSQP